MNTHETLMEQIRRLNEQEAVKHELKRQEAINKIKQLRKTQLQPRVTPEL
jgi:hypothetical protein